MTPARQGDLDGACGFYAVVNAVQLLYPKIDRTRLFNHIVHDHTQHFVHGTGRNQLNRVLQKAESFMASRRVGMPIRIERPFWKCTPATLEEYWETLRNMQGESEVPIIGYEFNKGDKPNTDAHWSVVRKVTKKHLILHDSDGTKRIPRERSQRISEYIRHQRRPYFLDTTATFVIARAE